MTKEEFRTIRINAKYTQAEFAGLLGYKRPITISDKERGVRSITQADINQIRLLMELERL